MTTLQSCYFKNRKRKPAKRKLTGHNQSVPLRLSQLSQLINNFSIWRQTIQINNSGFNNYWLPAAYRHAPIKLFTNVWLSCNRALQFGLYMSYSPFSGHSWFLHHRQPLIKEKTRWHPWMPIPIDHVVSPSREN